MNSNIYELAGSSASFNTHYELGSGVVTNGNRYCNAENQLATYGHRLKPDVLSQWSQAPAPHFRPPYQEGMATGYAPDPRCEFRSEVLDDCAKARFYARALEFYLLENGHQNGQFSCPLAACPMHFDNSKDMLHHLKNCKKFADGAFWCPTCNRYESFRVRSGRRCSWDKDHFGRKLVQMSKSVFQGSGNDRPATQQTSVCPMCSAHFWDVSVPGNSQEPMGLAHQQVQSSQPISRPVRQSAVVRTQLFCEMESSPPASELSGESSCESSPSQSWPGVGYTHQHSPSEVSALSEGSTVSVSPSRMSISTGMSPSSSTRGETSTIARRHNSATIRSKVNRRMAGLFSEADTYDRVLNQRAVSLHGYYGFQPLVSVGNAESPGDVVASSTLPSTLGQPASSRPTPRLRLDTARESINLAELTPDLEQLLQESQDPNILVTTGSQGVTSLPATIANMQSGEMSFLDDLNPREHFFEMQPSPSILVSPPLPDASTPDSSSSTMETATSSEQHMKCDICGWRPKQSLRSYLNKHMKTHQPRTPIPCCVEDCDSTFTRTDNLNAHLKKTHQIVNLSPSKRRRGSLDSPESMPQPKKTDLRDEEVE